MCTINMDLCFFHPDTVRKLTRRNEGPVPLRVGARGGRTPIELEMGERISNLPGYQSDFMVASACTPLEEMGDTAMIISSGSTGTVPFGHALDPVKVSSRTVLTRVGESFSCLLAGVQRLQDEGIVHGDICKTSVAYRARDSRPLLEKFAFALPIHDLAEKGRRRYYPAFNPARKHLPPEYHLLTRIVHSDSRAVQQSMVDEVCRELGCVPGPLESVVGLPVGDATAALESTWQTWDAYSLSCLFEDVLKGVTKCTDISLNGWLCGALSVWENARADDPTLRPRTAHLKRLFEKAWYCSGSIQDCQDAVEAVDLCRTRASKLGLVVDCS